MKVAYLYSGLYRTWSGREKNHRLNLPEGDFYYSTWDSERSKVTRDNMMFFPDPIKTYNCYEVKEFGDTYGWHLKDKGSEKPRNYTGYFQHLAHWYILNSLKEEYDVVVRMRYDTILGMGKEKFAEMLNLCYNSGNSIGLGNTNGQDDANKTMHYNVPQATPLRGKNPYMLDFANIHKPEVCKNVKELVDAEQMWPTNAGWYQIMGHNGYMNFKGGIQLKRYT